MPEPDAAVAIVHAKRPEDSVLLIRRTERENDPWSGHWSLPGGRRDPGDIDPLHTALRELHEECGIHLKREQLETALPPMEARRRSGPFLLVAPFVFRVECELPATPDLREAEETRWVPLRLLRDPGRHRVQCVPGMPNELAYPCVPLTGPPLWGFTYRLIADWLGLCPREQAAREATAALAGQILEALLAHGLSLRHGWVDDGAGRKTAAVEGAIPVGLIKHDFRAAARFPALNALEVRPGRIRLVGLGFEEYRIDASGAGAEGPEHPA